MTTDLAPFRALLGEVELSASSARIPLVDVVLGTLEALMEAGHVEDVVLAQSEAQRRAFWTVRETIPEAEKHAGGSVKLDIAVPTSAVSVFLAQGRAIVERAMPGTRLSFYGHVGDGNIHFNLMVPAGADRIAFTRTVEDGVAHAVYEAAIALGGSFSAEYGIGRFKRGLLERYGDATRLKLLDVVKRGVDPAGVMNAGAMV